MPKDKQEPSSLKVTDKRIFTPEGEVKEEFREQVKPAEPAKETPQESKPMNDAARESEKKKSIRDKAANPGTPFTNFIETLILNTYMSLGMVRMPNQPPMPADYAAARQMIEILKMLEEKTKGNLTEEEADFFETHLGDVKLAFVQRSKTI